MNTLTLKLYPETEALYKKLKEESDTQTADQFMSTLLENYQNPRKIEVEKRTVADEVEIEELKQKCADSNEAVLLEREKNKELTRQLHEAGIIAQNQVMFTLTEEERALLDAAKQKLAPKYGDLSDEKVLFWLIDAKRVKR